VGGDLSRRELALRLGAVLETSLCGDEELAVALPPRRYVETYWASLPCGPRSLRPAGSSPRYAGASESPVTGGRAFGRVGHDECKKIDNHIHALSLYFVFYNFVRTHKAHKLSPAMAAGVTDKLWSMEDIDALIEARAKKPGKRGPYKRDKA
jgi:hypothetical protein